MSGKAVERDLKNRLSDHIKSLTPGLNLLYYLDFLDSLYDYLRSHFILLGFSVFFGKAYLRVTDFSSSSFWFRALNWSPFKFTTAWQSQMIFTMFMTVLRDSFRNSLRYYSVFTVGTILYKFLCFYLKKRILKNVKLDLIKDHENYIIDRTYQDYCGYQPHKNRANSLRELIGRLDGILENFYKAHPFYPMFTSLGIVLVLGFLLEAEFLLNNTTVINYFLYTLAVFGVPAALYLRHKLPKYNIKAELQSKYLIDLDQYVLIVSDFLDKIKLTFALNVITVMKNRIESILKNLLVNLWSLLSLRESLETLEYVFDFFKSGLFIVGYLHVTTSSYIFGQLGSVIGIAITPCVVSAILDLVDHYEKEGKNYLNLVRCFQLLELDNRGDVVSPRTYHRAGVKTGVTVKGLTYMVGAEKNVRALNDVSFRVNPNEKIAIIGHSGSGKSTLVSLLAGMPQELTKKINLDDPSLSIRENVFILSQDSQFFIGSVRANISLGSPLDLSVLERVGLPTSDSFLDRTLSSDARQISGGQKQRIAFARALHLLRKEDASIVIFDESFSSLDPSSKTDLTKYALELLKDKVLLFVVHDETVLHLFDKILLLKAGVVMTLDTYEGLKNSPFYDTYLLYRD